MSACSRQVYPPDVIEYVKSQLKRVPDSPDRESSNANLPESMRLTERMKEEKALRDALLIKLNIDPVGEKVSEVDVFRAHEVVEKYTEYLEDIPIFGIVKETGVDDSGLVEFHRDYFPYPLYRDQSYIFYRALGDRKLMVSFLLNPFLIFHVAFDAWQRLTKKKISGNIKGEGIVQGGIILFDRSGTPVAMYQEETGTDLPVTDLVNAVVYARRRQENGTSS